MRPDSRTAGYTLIEVLVAFMILALALTVIFRIFAGGVRNVSVSSDYATAALIGESLLAGTGIDGRLSPGQSSGVDGEHFEWVRTIEAYTPSPDYTPASNNVAAYHVTVSIAWPHGRGMRRVKMSTVKLISRGRRGS